MFSSTKLDEKLEGPHNYRAWKYKIYLVLEENDLLDYVQEEVAEPEDEETKVKYKKNMAFQKFKYSMMEYAKVVPKERL